MEKLEHLKIPLSKVKLATNHFGPENFIGQGGFGPVYKGQLFHSWGHYNVAVKRLNLTLGQGQREFLTEIYMLSCFKHKNLVSLIGFCDEGSEKVLVYEQEIHGSLDRHLGSVDLTWMQRLRICLGAAHGLNYLHSSMGGQPSVLHRDIKSSNVLLDENWEAKLSDFGLSKIGPSNQQYSFLVSNGCGTMGYVDPAYIKTGILTKESDVYSFGVLLFEVLCGRLGCMLVYEDERRFLAQLAHLRYEQGRLDDIINPLLRERMNRNSLGKFSKIAYQCLKEDRRKRPKMDLVVQELQKALEIQLANSIKKTPLAGYDGAIRWSFHLGTNHKLKKITVLHDDEIYSLSFTTKDPDGQLHHSRTFGRKITAPYRTEVNLDNDEKITGIRGTIGGFEVTWITSLSFVTNKKHCPSGQIRGREFSVSCDKGTFAGFYGYYGDLLHAIGLYLVEC